MLFQSLCAIMCNIEHLVKSTWAVMQVDLSVSKQSHNKTFYLLIVGKSMEPAEIKSILKPEPLGPDLEVKGILKSGVTEYTSSQLATGHGILKEVTQEMAETRSILKKDSSFEARTDVLPERGVLKKESSFESRTEPEKSVLKKESTFERVQQTSSRGILKDSSFESGKDAEPAGILKSPTKTKGHMVHGVINGAQPHTAIDTVTTETTSVAMATTATFTKETSAILRRESDSQEDSERER